MKRVLISMLLLGFVSCSQQDPIAQDTTPGNAHTMRAQEWREWKNTWFGIEMQQYGSDLFIYEDLIYQNRPDAIVETGTFRGGLTIYMSSVLKALEEPTPILTIDLDFRKWDLTCERVRSGELKLPENLLDRVSRFSGSSTSPEAVEAVKEFLAGKERPLIILDSLHTKEHVLNELNAYEPFVPPGGIIVVTDTQLDNTGHLSEGIDGAGPLAAAKDFLKQHKDFEMVEPATKTAVSALHEGILRRVKPSDSP